MSRTKSFRKQHEELLELTSKISSYFDEETLPSKAGDVSGLLKKLLNKLNVHLALEDKSLYPRLLQHSDEKISKTAQDFIEEMGGIGQVVKEYKKQWGNELKIQMDPNGFIQQTQGIFDALSKRIDKENNELYEMVDRLS